MREASLQLKGYQLGSMRMRPAGGAFERGIGFAGYGAEEAAGLVVISIVYVSTDSTG